MRVPFRFFLGGAALVFLLPALAILAENPKRVAGKPTPEVVELFAGMKAGDIEVKLIPKDSTGGTITIKNKTARPLTIKIPPAFAGVPVQAQFGGGGMMGGGGGMMGGGGGMMGGMGGGQGMGGGMMGGGGGMMGGGGGMMGGGGMFNVAAEKVAKVKIVTVCLDHGKKDPSPRIPYKLIPIESYAKNAEVTEVLKLLTSGQLDQHSAQAAIWHVQNGLSWEQLAAKIGAKHLNGSTEPYFTGEHLRRALHAIKIAEERAAEKSDGESPAASVGEQVASQ